MDMATLDKKLLAAHSDGDQAALVRIYWAAGAEFIAHGNVDAGCFYLTHAYIHALELNDPAVAELHQLLVAHDREK